MAASAPARGWQMLAGLLMTLFSVFVAVIVVVAAFTRELSPATAVTVFVLGEVLAVLGFVLGLARMRAALATGAHLRLDEGLLTIDHPALFREPLRVPREAVALVAIDPTTGRAQRIGDRKRFVVTEQRAEGNLTACLYSSRRGAPVPIVGQIPPDIPNVLIVFRQPIRMPVVRRAVRALWTKHPELAPSSDAEARGLLVKVAQPERAATAFAAWRVLRPLTLRDIASLHPPDDEATRRSRVQFLAHSGVVAVVAAQIAMGWMLAETETQVDSNNGRSLAAVSASSSGSTLVSPTTGMKFVSPPQRGTT